MSDDAQRKPDYYTTVWLDPEWKAAYLAASDDERREVRRRGVKIGYRHEKATGKAAA